MSMINKTYHILGFMNFVDLKTLLLHHYKWNFDVDDTDNSVREGLKYNDILYYSVSVGALAQPGCGRFLSHGKYENISSASQSSKEIGAALLP